MRSSIELPSIRDHFKQEQIPQFQSSRPRELLPSILAHSPPGRSTTLPPIQRIEKIQRPRKSSVGQNARKAKHERTKSKEFARRLSIDGRKAMSAEPPTAAWAQGKRWEDLIEAATSATEADDDRDLTPVSDVHLLLQSSRQHVSSRRSEVSKRPKVKYFKKREVGDKKKINKEAAGINSPKWQKLSLTVIATTRFPSHPHFRPPPPLRLPLLSNVPH